ncbi:four helix bundle protein [Flavobacterium sp. J372]|uniref:four helix bundle protein n=1 Tax=Flavobacterium sp. J372 TaxID=2898436 RepID=UPI002151771C|nr:four helix bundle protein [Flavobacterium sp. J372]MCR5862174.1 four helix bundle protein [Flavobacterium sp. J372]
MSNFRNLIVWQKAMTLVTNVYQATQHLPREESFGLTSQIRRSSISIPSNIAEGYGRNSDTELSRFLNITIGSLFELQTQLEIAYNIGYLNQELFNNLFDQSREVEIMLSSLNKKVRSKN